MFCQNRKFMQYVYARRESLHFATIYIIRLVREHSFLFSVNIIITVVFVVVVVTSACLLLVDLVFFFVFVFF